MKIKINWYFLIWKLSFLSWSFSCSLYWSRRACVLYFFFLLSYFLFSGHDILTCLTECFLSLCPLRALGSGNILPHSSHGKPVFSPCSLKYTEQNQLSVRRISSGRTELPSEFVSSVWWIGIFWADFWLCCQRIKPKIAFFFRVISGIVLKY